MKIFIQIYILPLFLHRRFCFEQLFTGLPYIWKLLCSSTQNILVTDRDAKRMNILSFDFLSFCYKCYTSWYSRALKMNNNISPKKYFSLVCTRLKKTEYKSTIFKLFRPLHWEEANKFQDHWPSALPSRYYLLLY